MLLAALLALYFVPLTAGSANAATVGGFEIEGNLVDDTPADPPIDWFDLGPGSPGFSTGVDNVDDTGQDTTTFKGASKEYNLQNEAGGWPNWEFGTGNATGKSDFGRWATFDFVDSNDHVWFFFAFDRGFGTGTAKYAFELNQLTQSPTTDANPDRSQGDIRMIIWDQGNGVVTLTPDDMNQDVGLYVWDDPDVAGLTAGPLDSDQDGTWVKSSQTGVFAGASNVGDDPVAVPSWWTGGNVVDGTLTKDTFLEFGVDLTSFGAVLGCPSAGFSAVNARSITGTGGPGTLVDYLAAIPVTIPSDCGFLTIKKVLNGPIAGASTNFVVALDCAGTQYDASIALNASNGFADGPRPIAAGTQCSVTETSVPAGWTLQSISPSGTFTVGSNTAVTVTVTNKRNTGAIAVTKNIVDAPSGTTGSFTFDVDCPGTEFDQSLTISVGSGTSASKATGQIPTGLTCTVTERSNPNWKQTSVVPAGGVVAVPGTVTFANAPVTEVLPVKEVKPPKVLPRTGGSVEPGMLVAAAVAMVGLGLMLMVAGRRREVGDH